METWGFAISLATCQPGNRSEWCLFKTLTLRAPDTLTADPPRGGAPIGAGGKGVISPPLFLHRGGQGVHKLMTIILHVFKHVMYFF